MRPKQFAPAALALLFTVASAQDKPAPTSPRTAADLLESMKSHDFAVRRDAVWACRNRREPELRSALIDAATTADHPNIRGFALEVLGESHDRSLFDLYRKALETDDNVFPRQAALEALGATRDPRAYDVVLERLDDLDLTGAAAKGLGALGDRRAFDVLKKRLVEHADQWQVRELYPGALLALDPPAATAFLEPLLFDGPEALIQSVAVAVAPSADVEFATRCVETALDDRADPARRRGAFIVACTKPTPDAAARTLRKWPALAATEFAMTAANLILRSATPADAEAIVKVASETPDSVVSATLIGALGRSGNRKSAKYLVSKLEDGTYLAQPKTWDSIHPFPWNVKISHVAAWSLAILVDGREPCELDSLSRFPDPPTGTTMDAIVKRLDTWWSHLEDREPWSF